MSRLNQGAIADAAGIAQAAGVLSALVAGPGLGNGDAKQEGTADDVYFGV